MKFPRLQFSALDRFLSKFPGFSNPEKHSLWFLNSTQFFGALNDNIYKLALVFFLIEIEGAAHANTILSVAGAVFVIPFLLFSSMAGILADRFSKNRIVIVIKAAEIIIMLLVIAAFILKQTWGGYALLFLLAAQSAMFGPSKYGIIPELVSKSKVSKANGLITSFTYLAIILGTFLASFLTQITHGNYIIVGCFCLVVAIVGFLSSFGIKHTPPKGSTKKINILFIKQIVHTLSDCKRIKHLLVAIYGSAFFLFIGAFTQLNIIPFAMQELGLSKEAGGYLFLVTAMGIAFGAYLAGRFSKKRIELGLTCLSGILLTAIFFALGASSSNLPLTIISLFLLGMAGGNFTVPFDTYIQVFSPEENRGHVIAATNFLSFIGVLMASIALYLFNEVLGLSSAMSFTLVGALTLLFSLFLLIRLSDLFLSYTAKRFLYLFIPIKPVDVRIVHREKNPMLMLENGSFIKAWLLCGLIPNIHLLVPQYKTRRFPWFQRFFYSLHRVDSPKKFEMLVSHGKTFMDGDMIPCIYLRKKKPVPEKGALALDSLFARKKYEVISVNFEKSKNSKTTIVRFSK